MWVKRADKNKTIATGLLGDDVYASGQGHNVSSSIRGGNADFLHDPKSPSASEDSYNLSGPTGLRHHSPQDTLVTHRTSTGEYTINLTATNGAASTSSSTDSGSDEDGDPPPPPPRTASMLLQSPMDVNKHRQNPSISGDVSMDSLDEMQHHFMMTGTLPPTSVDPNLASSIKRDSSGNNVYHKATASMKQRTYSSDSVDNQSLDPLKNKTGVLSTEEDTNAYGDQITTIHERHVNDDGYEYYYEEKET